MPIRTYTDIFCDDCGNWEHTGEHSSRRRARAKVFGDGWRTVKRDGELVELCPRCAYKAGVRYAVNPEQAAR